MAGLIDSLAGLTVVKASVPSMIVYTDKATDDISVLPGINGLSPIYFSGGDEVTEGFSMFYSVALLKRPGTFVNVTITPGSEDVEVQPNYIVFSPEDYSSPRNITLEAIADGEVEELVDIVQMQLQQK